MLKCVYQTGSQSSNII